MGTNTNKRVLLNMACLLLLLVMGAPGAVVAEKATSEDQLTGAGEKLLAQYTEMLTALQADIAKAAPEIDAKKRDAFLKAHAAVGGAQPYQGPVKRVDCGEAPPGRRGGVSRK